MSTTAYAVMTIDRNTGLVRGVGVFSEPFPTSQHPTYVVGKMHHPEGFGPASDTLWHHLRSASEFKWLHNFLGIRVSANGLRTYMARKDSA